MHQASCLAGNGHFPCRTWHHFTVCTYPGGTFPYSTWKSQCIFSPLGDGIQLVDPYFSHLRQNVDAKMSNVLSLDNEAADRVHLVRSVQRNSLSEANIPTLLKSLEFRKMICGCSWMRWWMQQWQIQSATQIQEFRQGKELKELFHGSYKRKKI